MDILALEKKRKAELLKVVFASTLFILGILATLYAFTFADANTGRSFAILGVASFMVAGIWITDIIKKFERLVKTNCINNIVEKIVAGRGEIFWEHQSVETLVSDEMCEEDLRRFALRFDLAPYGYIGESKILSNRTFLGPMGGFSETSDDRFYGEYEGVKLIIDDIEVETGSGKSRRAVFRGMVLVLGTKQEFSGHTIIANDLKSDDASLQEIQLGNGGEFARRFKVYTNNVGEATGILNSRLADVLLGFKNDVRMAVYDSKVVLAISFVTDLFKLGSLFKPVNDVAQYHKFDIELRDALKTVEALKSVRELNL